MKPLPIVAALALAVSASALAATEENPNHRSTLAPGQSLVVDVDFGAIVVTTNATREVVVSVHRQVTLGSEKKERAFLAERPVKFEATPEGLSVKVVKKGFGTSGWHWGRTKLEGLYTISLPADCRLDLHTAGGRIEVTGTQADVTAGTSGGGLKFSGIHGTLRGNTSGGSVAVSATTGDLKVDTSGGSIEVRGGGGKLGATTSGGEIRVVDFAGPARVDTSGGGITVENVGGAVQGSTSGGGISATVTSPLPGPVRLETSGGGITFTAPETAAFDLDARTSGGGVSSDLEVRATGEKHRNQLIGPVNGGGTPVGLSTSGGSIRIKRAPASFR